MAKLLYMVIRKADMQVVQLGALESACAKQFLEDPENGVFRIWKGRL